MRYALLTALVALGLAPPPASAGAPEERSERAASEPRWSVDLSLGRRRSLNDRYDRWSSTLGVRAGLLLSPYRALHFGVDLSLDWGRREEAIPVGAESYDRVDVHRLGALVGVSVLLGGPAANLYLRLGGGAGFASEVEDYASRGAARIDAGYGFTLSRGRFLFRGEVAVAITDHSASVTLMDQLFTFSAGYRL